VNVCVCVCSLAGKKLIKRIANIDNAIIFVFFKRFISILIKVHLIVLLNSRCQIYLIFSNWIQVFNLSRQILNQIEDN